MFGGGQQNRLYPRVSALDMLATQAELPVFFGVSGCDITRWERDFLRDAKPMGFILFARNIDSADQIRALCHDLRDAVGYDAPIMIDQEGGRVQRLRAPIAREWLPPLDHADGATDAAQVFHARFAIIAAELRALGIDSNCAPCLDIATPQTHPFLQNRCYGRDADRVIELGQAAYDGLCDGGVVPIVKHMPGHGRAQVDSHHDLPHVTADLASLEMSDFAVFRHFNSAPMAMTAHIIFDALDPNAPVTTSPQAVDYLRNAMGFDGFLISDDVSMQALPGTLQDRCNGIMAAGCDAVLHCNGDRDEMLLVANQLRTPTDAMIQRLDAFLAFRDGVRDADLDIGAMLGQLES